MIIENSNYIEIKTTVWERNYFSDDENMESIINQIGIVNGVLWNNAIESETIYDSSTEMTVEENDGRPTIEVYKEGKLIWDNVNKYDGKSE